MTTPSLKDLYRALEFERALNFDDPQDVHLYVSDLHGEESSNPVNELYETIRMTDTPGTWLFTGHRGVGKSTELLRLAHRLNSDGMVAIVSDVSDYLNLNEAISTETLLLTAVAGLVDGADALLGGKHGEATFLQRFWQFAQTEIKITEANVKLPGDILSARLALTNRPDLLDKVKTVTGGATARLAQQVRGFMKGIVDEIKQQRGPQTEVVLILDSLEKLRVSGSNSAACYDAICNTFETNGGYLKMEHLHMVYAVPPYLPFLVPRIGSFFGVEICTLPHVKVFATPSPSLTIQAAQPCAAGQELMLQSVSRRYPQVEQLLPRAVLLDLALAASGGMRDYFRLIRSVCTKGQVAGGNGSQAADWALRAKQMLRNEMPLAEADKKWLRAVRRNHRHSLDEVKNVHQLARLFDSGVILSYRNGDDWCEVHYLLHDQIDDEAANPAS